ncbi:FtsX-like permease family protein, partial [Blautia obeum]
MLRAIGLSKKKVRFMIEIESIIVLALGLIFGFLIGTLASYA